MSAQFNTITEALTALGDTPDAVYQNLYALGIKGKPAVRCKCPVANYLTRTLGKPCDVGTTMAGYQNTTDEYVFLPEAVRQFVNDFDCELKYQDLLDI